MKTTAGIIGLLLIVGTLFGGNLKYITNWSTFELAGYNIGALFAIIGGGYLCYWGLQPKKKE